MCIDRHNCTAGSSGVPIRRRQDLPPNVGEIIPPLCQEDALHCAAGAGQLAVEYMRAVYYYCN